MSFCHDVADQTALVLFESDRLALWLALWLHRRCGVHLRNLGLTGTSNLGT